MYLSEWPIINCYWLYVKCYNSHTSSSYTHAVDFSLSNQTLVFIAGDTAGAQQCAFVDITDDIIVENNETFVISFATVDPAVEFLTDQAAVTIIDDDGKSMIIP